MESRVKHLAQDLRNAYEAHDRHAFEQGLARLLALAPKPLAPTERGGFVVTLEDINKAIERCKGSCIGTCAGKCAAGT